MLIIPLQPTASQIVTVVLGGQNCTLKVYQKAFGLFIDVYVSSSLIIGGVACRKSNKIVRDAYLGFIGDLAFYDIQGQTDPVYGGLGSRYVLAYIGSGELL